MERKSFSLSFSIPSFLKRAKTEDVISQALPSSSSAETQKNDHFSSDLSHQAAKPFLLSDIGVPPSSPSMTSQRLDAFATPRRRASTNLLPKYDTPRPSIHETRVGHGPPRPPASNLKRRSIQTMASSLKDIQCKEGSQLESQFGASMEDFSEEKAASPRSTFPFRLNIPPRPSPLKRKSRVSFASISTCEEQVYSMESTTIDEDLSAAFAPGGHEFDNPFSFVKTAGSRSQSLDEPVRNARNLTACDPDQDEKKLAIDRELEAFRVKLTNAEKRNSDLIAENSTLNSELEATAKRTHQLEAECKGLAEHLLETEEASKALTHEKENLINELRNCKVEKVDTEAEVNKLKKEIDALDCQLRERNTALEVQESEKEVLSRKLQEALENISVNEGTINSYLIQQTSLETLIAKLSNDLSKANAQEQKHLNNITELKATITGLEDEGLKLSVEITNARLDFEKAVANYKREIEDGKISHDSTKAVLEEATARISVLEAGLKEAAQENQRKIEEEKVLHEATRAALEEAKARISVLRADYEEAVEEHQHQMEAEKLSHETTKAALEEAKTMALVLKADYEKSNESLVQLQSYSASIVDDKFTLETRVHTLLTELHMCEKALDNALDKASTLESSESTLETLLAETKAKLETTQADLDKSKSQLLKLQLDSEIFLSKKKTEVELGEKASLGSMCELLEGDLKNQVMVLDAALPPDTSCRTTKLEETRFVNSICTPDMFENDSCYTCHAVKLALQAPKSPIDAVSSENLDKCNLCQGILKAIELTATSSLSHVAFCEVLEEFVSNPMTKEDDCKISEAKQMNVSADISNDITTKEAESLIFLNKEKGKPTKKLFQDLLSLVDEVVKKNVGDYAQAISMLTELFNDLRALTRKYENSRSMMESVGQEIIAYKTIAFELINSSSFSQQETEKKLAMVEKENLTLKNAERELIEGLTSLREELNSAKAHVLTLKQRNEESEKIIKIYNGKIADLGMNLQTAEDKLKTALGKETQLEIIKTSLEKDLLAARGLIHSHGAKMVETYNEKVVELEMNLRIAEAKSEAAMENESKLKTMQSSLENELLATRDQIFSQDMFSAQLDKALSDLKECEDQLDKERAANKTATASIIEYREKLEAVKSELDAKAMDLKEKEGLLQKRESQIQSLNQSVIFGDQNYKAAQEQIKSKDSILKAIESELSSLEYRHNLAMVDLYKTREKLTKCSNEKEKLKRETETLNIRIAALAKSCECQFNPWNSLTEDQQTCIGGEAAHPLVAEVETIKQEQETVNTTQEDVTILAPEEPSKALAVTPSRMKKRLRLLSPSLKVKQEPPYEVVSPKKAFENSAAHQGKGGKRKGVAAIVNDDDEFYESASTVAPVKRTYTRAGSKATTSTPKVNRMSKPAAAPIMLATPSVSRRKRSKTTR